MEGTSSVHCFMGPMCAGKTSYVLDAAKNCLAVNLRVLMVKYKNDTRYEDEHQPPASSPLSVNPSKDHSARFQDDSEFFMSPSDPVTPKKAHTSPHSMQSMSSASFHDPGDAAMSPSFITPPSSLQTPPDQPTLQRVVSHDGSTCLSRGFQDAFEVLAFLERHSRDFDVLVVDEGQFFNGLVKLLHAATSKYHMTCFVAALDADHERQCFPAIRELLQNPPEATSFYRIRAICETCPPDTTQPAVWTRLRKASMPGDSNVLIGGTDLYQPLCNACYEREVPHAKAPDPLLQRLPKQTRIPSREYLLPPKANASRTEKTNASSLAATNPSSAFDAWDDHDMHADDDGDGGITGTRHTVPVKPPPATPTMTLRDCECFQPHFLGFHMTRFEAAPSAMPPFMDLLDLPRTFSGVLKGQDAYLLRVCRTMYMACLMRKHFKCGAVFLPRNTMFLLRVISAFLRDVDHVLNCQPAIELLPDHVAVKTSLFLVDDKVLRDDDAMDIVKATFKHACVWDPNGLCSSALQFPSLKHLTPFAVRKYRVVLMPLSALAEVRCTSHLPTIHWKCLVTWGNIALRKAFWCNGALEAGYLRARSVWAFATIDCRPRTPHDYWTLKTLFEAPAAMSSMPGPKTMEMSQFRASLLVTSLLHHSPGDLSLQWRNRLSAVHARALRLKATSKHRVKERSHQRGIAYMSPEATTHGKISVSLLKLAPTMAAGVRWFHNACALRANDLATPAPFVRLLHGMPTSLAATTEISTTASKSGFQMPPHRIRSAFVTDTTLPWHLNPKASPTKHGDTGLSRSSPHHAFFMRPASMISPSQRLQYEETMQDAQCPICRVAFVSHMLSSAGWKPVAILPCSNKHLLCYECFFSFVQNHHRLTAISCPMCRSAVFPCAETRKKQNVTPSVQYFFVHTNSGVIATNKFPRLRQPKSAGLRLAHRNSSQLVMKVPCPLATAETPKAPVSQFAEPHIEPFEWLDCLAGYIQSRASKNIAFIVGNGSIMSHFLQRFRAKLQLSFVANPEAHGVFTYESIPYLEFADLPDTLAVVDLPSTPEQAAYLHELCLMLPDTSTMQVLLPKCLWSYGKAFLEAMRFEQRPRELAYWEAVFMKMRMNFMRRKIAV